MEINLIDAHGFEAAMMGMRLPMKSGSKSDGYWDFSADPEYIIGDNDYELSMKLIRAGTDHRKHIRLIDAWIEIDAPLYWWKEFDTYRFGVDKVSESTMHTLKKHEISEEDFDLGEYKDNPVVQNFIDFLERHRKADDIDDLSKILPQSYRQKRICKVSYEALRNMYQARKNHKLPEWREFCDWIKYNPPYPNFITKE